MEKDIMIEMFRDLEKEFCLYYGQVTIDEWKSFGNKWYCGMLSKYQYELEKYICENLMTYLQNKIQKFNLTSEEKNNIFKQLNKTKYRKVLFVVKNSLISKEFVDYKYIDDCLNKGDLITIGHILSNAENAMEIYSYLESDWRYQTTRIQSFRTIISQMQNTKNKEVFNLVFDDLCLIDAEYGQLTISILENNIKELNENNVVSLVKSIYIGGKTVRLLDKEYKKVDMVLDFIKTKKIESVSTPFVTELLEVISLDEEDLVISEIISKLSCEEKEKMKFYLPKSHIKKV